MVRFCFSMFESCSGTILVNLLSRFLIHTNLEHLMQIIKKRLKMEISSENYFIFFLYFEKYYKTKNHKIFQKSTVLIKFVFYKFIPLFISKSNNIVLG